MQKNKNKNYICSCVVLLLNIFFCILLHCLSGPDFIYISLLIIPCIIYYVTNKETFNLVDVKDQRRMDRLVRDDRKATVTQITTRYNQDMQNTISERTTHRTLKQMGFSSRRPHRVPLLSAKNRKQSLQFTQAHQNWTIEDWKNVALSDESRYLLRHLDGRVRIWRKEHESMDPSCLVSTVQAGGGVGGVMV